MEVSTHGAGLAAPFSKPPLPINSVDGSATVGDGYRDSGRRAHVASGIKCLGNDGMRSIGHSGRIPAERERVALVLLAATAPSIRICIWVTPTLSEAVALMVTVPETVAPLAGDEMEVVGGVVSVAGVVTFSAKSSSTNEVCRAGIFRANKVDLDGLAFERSQIKGLLREAGIFVQVGERFQG